jgi:uracil-DNA glycosylase family 4
MILPKPADCFGCPLDTEGKGFVLPEGPTNAPLLWLGEAPGPDEVRVGRPFIGAAGSMLNRLLTLMGWARESIRIGNVNQCCPPGMWLEGAPYMYESITHCARYRDPLLAEDHKVVIASGAVAIKTVLGLLGHKKIRVNDFHGSVLRDPTDRFWVVPTFHPSFLQRGAHNLIGTVLWDLKQAENVLKHGKAEDTGSLIVDPPYEWFRSWVDVALEAIRSDPWAYPVTVDIETPDKAGGRDEGEITAEDRSYVILRINLSINPEEGITVPAVGPYLDEIKRLLAEAICWLWNKEYDIPRMIAAGLVDVDTIEGRSIDLMWLAHYLQSDVPRGLGFWAPFYSTYGPWKHLADVDPATYGAADGLQNHRTGFGIIGDLQRTGMYAGAMRHVHQLHHLVLKPAQRVGVKINRERLLIFKQDLTEKASDRLDRLQACVPDALRPLTPKAGLTKRPLDNVLHVKASAFTRAGKARKGKPVPEIKLDLYKKAVIVEKEIEREVFCCRGCGAEDVQRRHRCAVVGAVADLELQPRTITRFFWSEPFNPDSPEQVLNYIRFRKHTPGRAKKTQKDSTNKEALKKLVRTGDPFYPLLLDYRAINKVKGTYAEGTERRMDDEDRVHPTPTFRPSTMRLSYVDPNITNVVADKGGVDGLAAGYRKCVVAGSGSRFLEIDFSGSEAVDFGWFCRDPNYIRLAKLGVHAGLASYVLGSPYDKSASDEDLGAYFKSIKKSDDQFIRSTYERSKRFIHGYSYGLTINGMVLQFPEIFPTRKVAERYAAIFDEMAPHAAGFQQQVRQRAAKQHYLGGPGDHPFGYKHWFWSVYTYKKITSGQYWAILSKWKLKGKDESTAPVAIINGQYFSVGLGEDGKRVVAFYPQSTTAGKLKEVMLRLFDHESPSYIGDAYYGRTPLRAPIHDSLLLEIPTRTFDLVASIAFREMQRPFQELPMPAAWGLGEYLATGIAAKTGLDGASWGEMEDLAVPSFAELGVGSDSYFTAAEAEEDDEVEDLGREVA